MSEKHGGSIKLKNDFMTAFEWLQSNPEITFETEAGTKFTATAMVVSKGTHTGEKVIRIFQGGKEFSRSYECCWGYYTNCNKTRLGMYCQSIDRCI